MKSLKVTGQFIRKCLFQRKTKNIFYRMSKVLSHDQLQHGTSECSELNVHKDLRAMALFSAN